jgi:alcohol dehydrogenase YqhD (iron-dependent ADH family)
MAFYNPKNFGTNFQMSLDSFNFYNPVQVIFGKDSVEKLAIKIKEDGIKKVLLHFGGSSAKINGLYERVIKNLKDNNIDSIEQWG